MKNVILLVFMTLAIVSSVGITTANSQETQDKVVMLNGEEKVGKVTAINEANIKFVHKGESLEYTLKKEEINKIQFASGRIEIVNNSNNNQLGGAVNLQDHHNVVAILPFTFIGDGGANNAQLEKKAQSDCYTVLKKYASQFDLQDPIKTNATLLKHDIHQGNVEAFTPDELCNILGAEYVILGNITVLYTGSNSFSAGGKTEKEKGSRTNTFSTGSTSTIQNFKTQVSMSIYNDQGNNIFSKSHDSFWQTQNAYELTIQWLIKRSPLYRK